MAETAAEARSKLGRATSNVFIALFALAAVIAAGATYLAVTDESPVQAGQPGLLWLLIANLIIIASLATVFGARVLQLIRENRETDGGARLRLRIILLFSLAAAIPTIIVAGFLAVAINRSVANWFSRPVIEIVEGGTQAARAALDGLRTEVELEAKSIVADIAATPPPPEQATVPTLMDYLGQRSEMRGIFRRIEAFDNSGASLEPVLEAEEQDNPPPAAMKPTASDWAAARAGEILVREAPSSGSRTSITSTSRRPGQYRRRSARG
jgi:two-component system nitrogen regulation sensor histidine kinase NtrY